MKDFAKPVCKNLQKSSAVKKNTLLKKQKTKQIKTNYLLLFLYFYRYG